MGKFSKKKNSTLIRIFVYFVFLVHFYWRILLLIMYLNHWYREVQWTMVVKTELKQPATIKIIFTSFRITWSWIVCPNIAEITTKAPIINSISNTSRNIISLVLSNASNRSPGVFRHLKVIKFCIGNWTRLRLKVLSAREYIN